MFYYTLLKVKLYIFRMFLWVNLMYWGKKIKDHSSVFSTILTIYLFVFSHQAYCKRNQKRTTCIVSNVEAAMAGLAASLFAVCSLYRTGSCRRAAAKCSVLSPRAWSAKRPLLVSSSCLCYCFHNSISVFWPQAPTWVTSFYSTNVFQPRSWDAADLGFQG